MIATSGFEILPSNTCNTITLYATCAWSSSIIIDLPDDLPKRHIPFYRSLFDQSFPQPTIPMTPKPKRREWMPNMGRVRIDRTAL